MQSKNVTLTRNFILAFTLLQILCKTLAGVEMVGAERNLSLWMSTSYISCARPHTAAEC